MLKLALAEGNAIAGVLRHHWHWPFALCWVRVRASNATTERSRLLQSISFISAVNSSMWQGSSYTPYYCEENVYKLCEALLEEHNKDLYVVFISNKERRVWPSPLLQHCASP